MSAEITITSQDLPEGICFATEQERFNTFAAFLSAVLPGNFSSFNLGTSQPTADNQDKPWIKLNSDGSPVGVFTFSSGAWVRPHAIPASSNFIALWSGSTTDLETFDGGSAGAVTATTGPFWEVVTAFADKIPRGAGTVAVNVDDSQLSSGSSATDQVRGVYFIRRTARTMYVA